MLKENRRAVQQQIDEWMPVVHWVLREGEPYANGGSS
jgi:hypothetical protein